MNLIHYFINELTKQKKISGSMYFLTFFFQKILARKSLTKVNFDGTQHQSLSFWKGTVSNQANVTVRAL